MPEGHQKILLIEDEPLLANLLKQRLEKNSFEVLLARDGEEGLKILRETKPDLILLDIILPKISGFELMETLRNNTDFQQAPIIIISNLGQDNDIEKGQSLGAVGYFIKAKISIEELVQQVKDFIEGKKLSA